MLGYSHGMPSLWARLSSRFGAGGAREIELPDAGTPAREAAQRDPDTPRYDAKALEGLGGEPNAADDPDDPSRYLSGPTS